MDKNEFAARLDAITARFTNGENIKHAIAEFCDLVMPIRNQYGPCLEECAQKTLCGAILAMLHDRHIRPLTLAKLKDVFSIVVAKLCDC
jgi:hypothetical protein